MLLFFVTAFAGEHHFHPWHGASGMSYGPTIFWPQTFAIAFGVWTPTGASTNLLAIQRGSTDALDTSYISAPADNSNASVALVTFLAPALQGTPTGVRFVTRYAPFGTAGQAGGSRTFILIDPDLVTIYDQWDISSQNILGPGVWRTRNTVLTTDPRTGAAWTSAGVTTLMSSGVGLFASLVPTGNETGIAISSFYLEPLAPTVPGQGRWRLGPERHELVHVCVICGIPFHDSRLTLIRDPRHPEYNHYVCLDDIDEIDPEPTAPNFADGELSDDDT